MERVTAAAQEYLRRHDISGWLLYDYRGMNPVFWETVGPIANVTRPCWLWIPADGQPSLLVAYVDQGRFNHLGLNTVLFKGRENMISELKGIVGNQNQVAMEYSPNCSLPRISRVDAGTVDLVRGLEIKIISSADIVQYATQRWTEKQLSSHKIAAKKLSRIVQEAFDYIGDHIVQGVTEFEIAEFIKSRFRDEGLVVTDGPVVAVNEHSSDPHFNPTEESAVAIKPSDWILIDLWGRLPGIDAMFADITWTAFVGNKIPKLHQEVFDTVVGARDSALKEMQIMISDSHYPQGWKIDKIARDFIEASGFGNYFTHRLGHSLGREVHGNAVNLDSWETHDTREIIPGIGLTIEPGIYLPDFGVRSEIDVYISEEAPVVTTSIQRDIVTIS